MKQFGSAGKAPIVAVLIFAAAGLVAGCAPMSTEEQLASLDEEIARVESQIAEAEEMESDSEGGEHVQGQGCAVAGADVARIQTEMTNPKLSTGRGEELSNEMASYIEGGAGAATAPWLYVTSARSAAWTFYPDYGHPGPEQNVMWLLKSTDQGSAEDIIGWAMAVYNSEQGTFSNVSWGVCPAYSSYGLTPDDGVR